MVNYREDEPNYLLLIVDWIIFQFIDYDRWNAFPHPNLFLFFPSFHDKNEY